MKDNAMEELLSLKWNNHRSTFLHILAVLRDKQLYTDATLACDGKLYSVHKLVLSTCSDYFSSMLDRTSCKNPVIVLKDIKSDDLEALLDYMYLGEVNVRQSDLSTLIKAAECLRVKGLAVADDEPPPKKSKADTQSKRSESTSSPPAKRKRRSDVDDGRDDVRPSRGEHRQSSSPALSSSRPKSPSSGTYNSSKINSSNVNTRNSVEEPKNSNSSDSYVDTAPCIKVEMSDEADRPPDDESNMDGNTGDMGDELSDSYGLNSEDFKEENDQDGGDLNSDLPEFLQQATAGYQHSSFGGPSFQSDMPWQGSEDNGSGSSSSFNTAAAAAAAAAQFVPQDSSSQGASGESSSYYLPQSVLGKSSNTEPRLEAILTCSEAQATSRETSSFFPGVSINPTRLDESFLSTEHSAAGEALSMLSLEAKSISRSTEAGEQFPCPSCPKTFGRLWHLKRHMATHLAVRPYECPYCGYRVNFKDKLKLHLLKVHPNLPPINLNAMDAPFSIVKTKVCSFEEQPSKS